MSRRRPERRWRIGDRVMAPWYRRRSTPRGEVGGWHPAVVELVRGDLVVIREYGYERTLPWWELRPRGRGA